MITFGDREIRTYFETLPVCLQEELKKSPLPFDNRETMERYLPAYFEERLAACCSMEEE